MFVVLGASGHTGHVVATNLLAGGQKVRVVGRNAAALKPLAAKGAETFIADLTDSANLIRAFQHADSAYVMIPPNLTSNDPLGYSNRVSDAIATAVQKAGTKNVVALSSVGADKTSGTGPVLGLHHLEQKLNQISGANVLHLRAGYFMENTLPQVNAISQMGAVTTPLRPDLKIPMIATRDIGASGGRSALAWPCSRQANPRTAGTTRHHLQRGRHDHWQGHWQGGSQIRPGARRSISRSVDADGNVRAICTTPGGDDWLAQLRIHARA